MAVPDSLPGVLVSGQGLVVPLGVDRSGGTEIDGVVVVGPGRGEQAGERVECPVALLGRHRDVLGEIHPDG